MPAVVPVFQAAFTAVNAFAASSAVAGFLVNTVSSIAMSALATAIRGKPDQRQPGITTNTTTAGGTVPQRLIFGTYATAGQMVCPPMVYATDGNPNEWLTYVISLADKPVTALGRIFVDGQALTIDGNPAASANGDAMGVTVQATPGPDGLRDKIFIRFHDGRQTTPDAYLRRVFGTYPARPWTADMIGTGVAYAVITFKGKAQDGDYQGFPSVKFEVDGHPLYDPRDGAQNPANETTWKFTRNPAVIAYNILRGIAMPGGDRWGVGATTFILSQVIAAANVCAELVPVEGGGNRARYIAGLEVSVADEPHTALTEVVKAMAGDVADMGGTWLLMAGEPDGPVLSITDDDIIVTDSRSLRPYPGLDETYNAIHASYPDPGQQWEAKEAVPLYNADYEAKDGGRRLIAEVDFPAVAAPRQVRALMREMLADHRRHRTHVITLPPDALGVAVGQHIAWSSVINGYVTKLFKVMALRIDPVSLCVALTITERDPADYDYDAGSDGRLPTIPSAQPVVPALVGLMGFNPQPVNAGGKPGIRIGWNAEVRADAIAWTIRLKSDLSVVSRGSTADVAVGAVTLTAGLLPAREYLVSARRVMRRATIATEEVTVTTLDLRLGWPDLSPDILNDVTELETWMDNARPAIVALTARTDRTHAAGLFRVEPEATPTGAQARIGLRAEAGLNDTSHSAAMYLEARSDGTSQAGFVASRFFIVHGGASDSSRQVPFYVDGGRVYIDAAFIRAASIGTLELAGNSVIVPVATAENNEIRLGTVGAVGNVSAAAINNPTGAPVFILFNGQQAGAGPAMCDYYIFRNSTQLRSIRHTSFDNGQQTSMVLSAVDLSPPVGASNYTVRAAKASAGGYTNDVVLTNRTLSLQAVQR